MQAEEDLRRSAESFRLLFQDSPAPMWVYDWETLRFLEAREFLDRLWVKDATLWKGDAATVRIT